MNCVIHCSQKMFFFRRVALKEQFRKEDVKNNTRRGKLNMSKPFWIELIAAFLNIDPSRLLIENLIIL